MPPGGADSSLCAVRDGGGISRAESSAANDAPSSDDVMRASPADTCWANSGNEEGKELLVVVADDTAANRSRAARFGMFCRELERGENMVHKF